MCFLLFVSEYSFSQNYDFYSQLINKAELAAIDGNYKEALNYYQEGFSAQSNVFAKDYCNAAVCAEKINKTEKTFSFLSTKMQNTVSGFNIKKAIELKNLNSLSDSLRTTSFMNEKNNKTGIVTHNNKYTLVDFWFSNCGPCIKQFPKLISIYETYKNRGFEIIGISTDEKIDVWKNAISKYNLNWQQLWDAENLTSSKLLISSFPSNFSCGFFEQNNSTKY